jgi:hypothetical protein
MRGMERMIIGARGERRGHGHCAEMPADLGELNIRLLAQTADALYPLRSI